MHTAIYIRTSTDRQTTRSQDADLRKWASIQEGEVKWYTDKATGTNFDRPGWAALWGQVEAGQVSKVVVWRLDRMGRQAGKLISLLDELEAKGVGFFSFKESIDTSTPAGKLLRNILASVAQFETEVRSERMRAGIQAAKAQGVKWGGRKKGTRVTLSPEKEEAAKLMHQEGKSIAEIARVVGLSRQTVYKALGLWQRKPQE